MSDIVTRGTFLKDAGGLPASRAVTISIPENKVAPILDWNERKSVRTVEGKRMFAAAMTSRLTADWPVSISSANAEILVSAIATRSRLRQLERDDDYMRRMLRLFQNNVIGHQGIQLQMKIKDPASSTGTTKPKFNFDTAANQMVLDAWNKYLRPENCTVMRNMSGVKLQRLIVRCWKRDGAIMIRKHRGFNNPFRFAVQPLEIDYLNFYNCGRAPITNNKIMFGIEFDEFDSTVAYWILSRHPGEVLGNELQSVYQTRVPAEDIYMIFDIDRANQLVGMPDFCSIATRLNALHKYEEAEAVAARVAACKGGFISKAVPTDYTGPVDSRGNSLEEMSPGMVEMGEVGETWNDIDPKHPMDAYNTFVKGMIRGASSGSNLSYNTVANDLEGVNYSSFKAGRLEDTAQYQNDQTEIIDMLMQPLFDDWLPFAILSGQIKMPITKIQKIQDGCGWQPRVWDSVEPEKEANAAIKLIEAGLSSRRREIGKEGLTVDEIDEEREEDKASEKEHGLTPPEEVLTPSLGKGNASQVAAAVNA